MNRSIVHESLAYRYPRKLRLADGTPMCLRPVLAMDKAELENVMSHLSSESRRRRFFTRLSKLSPAMLRYLTEIDYDNHLALGVWARDREPPACVAVARYVRDPLEPAAAEPALTVVDAYQNRGLGTLLLALLMNEAWHHQITHFRAALLDDNLPVRRLLTSYGAHFAHAGLGVDTVDFKLISSSRR